MVAPGSLMLGAGAAAGIVAGIVFRRSVSRYNKRHDRPETYIVCDSRQHASGRPQRTYLWRILGTLTCLARTAIAAFAVAEALPMTFVSIIVFCAAGRTIRFGHCCKPMQNCSAGETITQCALLSGAVRVTSSKIGQRLVSKSCCTHHSAEQPQQSLHWSLQCTSTSLPHTVPHISGIRDQQKINLLKRARAFALASDSISAKELEEARLGEVLHLPTSLHASTSLYSICLSSNHDFCAEVLHPPKCEKREHQLPGPPGTDDVRQDDYYWLRDDDRTDGDVLAHLRVCVH